MLGALDARVGDCAGAIENYAKARNSIGQNAPALRQYGGCLLIVGRATEAVGPLSQLLAIKDDLSIRLMPAQAQSAAKDNVGTLATLKPVLSAVPPVVAALFLAAQIEHKVILSKTTLRGRRAVRNRLAFVVSVRWDKDERIAAIRVPPRSSGRVSIPRLRLGKCFRCKSGETYIS